MSRFLKVKMKTGGKKNDYKNLKDLNYQVDKAKTDETDEADETDETDKTDDETNPEWVRVSKNRFDEIRGLIIRNVNNGELVTVKESLGTANTKNTKKT